MMIAGAWQWPVYEKACADALTGLGTDIIRFCWADYFKGPFGSVQEAIPFPGPALFKLNRAIVNVAKEEKPEIVLVWRGTHILPKTLRAIKSQVGATLVSYNNDDPFGPAVHGHVPWRHHFRWRQYLKSVPEYDLHFVYRNINVPEILQKGAQQACVLMPYFIPEINRPVEISENELRKYACDIVFVGHYEPDGREQYLRALVEAGLHVRLFGGGYWTRQVLGNLYDYFASIVPAEGEDYAKALCGAKMCLAFLSKMNRDAYTRRCFEIPACGRLLLCERTRDLQGMFTEDKEAVFFSSPDELVNKALWLRDRPEEIGRIAQAGMRRVHADGHDVTSRMRQMLKKIADTRSALS